MKKLIATFASWAVLLLAWSAGFVYLSVHSNGDEASPPPRVDIPSPGPQLDAASPSLMPGGTNPPAEVAPGPIALRSPKALTEPDVSAKALSDEFAEGVRLGIIAQKRNVDVNDLGALIELARMFRAQEVQVAAQQRQQQAIQQAKVQRALKTVVPDEQAKPQPPPPPAPRPSAAKMRTPRPEPVQRQPLRQDPQPDPK